MNLSSEFPPAHQPFVFNRKQETGKNLNYIILYLIAAKFPSSQKNMKNLLPDFSLTSKIFSKFADFETVFNL